MPSSPLLDIHQLTITDSRRRQRLVNGVNLRLDRTSSLAVVGESGSGKSLLCKTLLGIQPPELTLSGSIIFEDKPLLEGAVSYRQNICGSQMGLIMQDAMSAFDPLYTIGSQFDETLKHHFTQSLFERRKKAKGLLNQVGFGEPEDILNKYPHQLSGGMLQRVMMALAIGLEPKLIIADEPTTSLDAISQYEVIRLLMNLRAKQNTAMIFVSHDLALVREIAQDVAVMYQGNIVEQGNTERIFSEPQHEYTRFLIETRRELSARFNQIMSKDIPCY